MPETNPTFTRPHDPNTCPHCRELRRIEQANVSEAVAKREAARLAPFTLDERRALTSGGGTVGWGMGI